MKFFKGGMDPYEYEIKLLNKNMGSDIVTGLDIRYHYDFWVYRALFFFSNPFCYEVSWISSRFNGLTSIIGAVKYPELPLDLTDMLQLLASTNSVNWKS